MQIPFKCQSGCGKEFSLSVVPKGNTVFCPYCGQKSPISNNRPEIISVGSRGRAGLGILIGCWVVALIAAGIGLHAIFGRTTSASVASADTTTSDNVPKDSPQLAANQNPVAAKQIPAGQNPVNPDPAAAKAIQAPPKQKPVIRRGPVRKAPNVQPAKPVQQAGIAGNAWVGVINEKRRFTGHTRRVTGVAFSPDGRFAASCSSDRTCRLWNVETGHLVFNLEEHSSTPSEIRFFPDGRRAVSVGFDGIRVWDLNTGLQSAHFGKRANCVAVSPDGKFVAVGTTLRSAQLWDPVTGKQVWEKTVTKLGGVLSIAFDPTGKTVKVAMGDEYRTLHVDSGISLMERKLPSVASAPPAFAFQDQQLAVPTAQNPRNRRNRTWQIQTVDMNTGKVLQSFGEQTAVTLATAFAKDDSRILTTGVDRIVHVWDAKSKTERFRLIGHEGTVNAVDISSDGRYALSGSDDKTVRLWDLTTGREIRRFGGDETDFIEHWVWTTVGWRYVWIICLYDHTIRYWDVFEKKEIVRLSGHTDSVRLFTMAANGQFALTAGDDRTIRIWDTKTGREVQKMITPDGVVTNNATLSADGKRAVLLTKDGAAKLLEVPTGLVVSEFKLQAGDRIDSLAISPDGQRVVAGSTQGRLYVWESSTGKPISVTLGYPIGSTAMVFSPEGGRVLTGHTYQVMRLWDLKTGQSIPLTSSTRNEIWIKNRIATLTTLRSTTTLSSTRSRTSSGLSSTIRRTYTIPGRTTTRRTTTTRTIRTIRISR